MSAESPLTEKATCFISYAREDTKFVRDLVGRLHQREIECKGDWLLVSGQDYETRLRQLNLGAHAFVFVISPDSIKSDACRSELLVAVENNKQILPIVHRNHGDDNLLDSALRSKHWTYLRDGDDFDRGFDDLVTALKTDFALMDVHTRLLVAAEDWHTHDRGRSYLWRKEGLKNAEQWLATVSSKPDKLPQPTEREVEFIFASQRARSSGLRKGFGVAVAIAAALIVLSVVALAQRGKAVENEVIAKTNEEEAVRQKTKAEENFLEANKQKGIAEDNLQEANTQRRKAEENLAEAERQRTKAEENLAEAKRQQAEALRQKKQAEDNLAEAKRQEAEANRQRKEAEDRGVKLQQSYSAADYRTGNQLLLTDDYAGGVAYLARALTTNPDNAPAADRLFTLVSTRDQPALINRIKPSSKVIEFDISSNGETVAVVSEQGEVTLEKAQGTKVRLDLNKMHAQTARFIPKTNSLLVITTTGSVLIFNSENPKPTFVHALPSPVSRYAFPETFEKLAVACADGSLHIIPLKDDGNKKVQVLEPVKGAQSLSFINYGLGLAVLADNGLHKWEDLEDPKTKSAPAPDAEHHEIDLAAIAHDGTYSYTELQGSGESVTAYVDVVVNGSSKANWKSKQYDYARAIDLDFNVNSTFLAATLDTEVVHIFRRNGTNLTLLHDGLTSSGVHPTKELLYSASNEGTVNLWNTANGKRVCAPLRHQQGVVKARFSEDGQYLAALTKDGTLNIWDINQREFTAEAKDFAGTSLNDPKGGGGLEQRDRKSRFFLSNYKLEGGNAVWELRHASDKKAVRIYRHPRPGAPKNSDADSDDGNDDPLLYASEAISEDGSTVVTLFGNTAARVWHTDSDKYVFELKTEDSSTSYANRIYLTPNGDKVLIGYLSPSDTQKARSFYRIYSLVDGKPLTGQVWLTPNQSLMDVSRDLERVIIGEGSSAYVRSPRDFRRIGQQVTHRAKIGEAVFLLDGRSFCTISYDASARIWDTETGVPLTEVLKFQRGKGKNWLGTHSGDPTVNDYDYSLPTPLLLDDARRVAIPYETMPGTKQVWDISIRTKDDDAKILVELLTIIHGERFNESGGVELLSQPTLAELKERFGKYARNNSDVGKLINWLLTPRASRSATPYSQK